MAKAFPIHRAFGALAALAFCSGPVTAQAPGQMNASPLAAAPVLPAPPPSAPSPAPPALRPSAPAAVVVPVAPLPGSIAVPAPAVTAVTPALSPAGAATAAAPKPKPKAPIREWALSTDPTPSFQPETFFTTVKASERYAKIVEAGGWPTVPGDVGPATRGPAVAALRKRLAAEGDLPETFANGETWDPVLAGAVKHFQQRNGLRPTGTVSGATLRALNVPAAVRFRQLASSAQRLAGLNFAFEDRHVVVNIPSATVETIENGVIAHRYVAVVGDVDHRSPESKPRSWPSI